MGPGTEEVSGQLGGQSKMHSTERTSVPYAELEEVEEGLL